MFFSIRQIKNVIVSLHDCGERNKEFLESLQKRLAKFNVFWLSRKNDKWWQQYGIKDEGVFFPENRMEALLLKNVCRRLITSRNLERGETVLISSDPDVLMIATELLLGSVYFDLDTASNGVARAKEVGVDFGVSDLDSLENCLTGEIAGKASEFFTATDSCFAVTKQRTPLLILGSIENELTTDFFGGRYFSRSDCRHDLHPLSLRIIDSKNNHERHAAAFSRAFAFLIATATKGEFDYICAVPPKPEQKDRFAIFLKRIDESQDFKKLGIKGERIRLDLLKCIKPYDSLKNFKAAPRPDLVKDAFAASADVAGKKIVLVDDVRTTGSTLTECAKTLFEAGAKSVIPVTLAYKPLKNIDVKIDDLPPYTGCCNWPGVIRFNRIHGEVFFGCSAWYYGDQVTHQNSKFAEITRTMLLKSDKAILKLDDELAADINF